MRKEGNPCFWRLAVRSSLLCISCTTAPCCTTLLLSSRPLSTRWPTSRGETIEGRASPLLLPRLELQQAPSSSLVVLTYWHLLFFGDGTVLLRSSGQPLFETTRAKATCTHRSGNRVLVARLVVRREALGRAALLVATGTTTHPSRHFCRLVPSRH